MFPVATVCSGAFFNDMNTWFADTFPFRESLLKLESGITRLYGIQSTTVVGDVQEGDDIPDTPLAEGIEDSSFQQRLERMEAAQWNK